jgi:ABC-type multidrug transport system ATPase subunit
MTAILTADCVAKSFGDRRVLSSASLRAVPGELRALLGRNGIGKSTLLKIAAGWIVPDTGAVHFADIAYLATSPAVLAARGLFFLPDHDLLSDAFSLGHQLEMFSRQFSGGNVKEVSARLGLADRLDRRPGSLSGGERRRADLAAVLVRRPRCLLADEPYRGIAPLDAAVLTETLLELARDGTAIVVTGHEVPILLEAAHHLTWCTSGTTYELGSPRAALEHDAFRREYLGAWLRTPGAQR